VQPADYTARLVAGQRIDEESVEENAAAETLDDGLRRDGANPIFPVQAMTTISMHSPKPTSDETSCSPVDCHKNAPSLPAQEELFDARRLKTDTFAG